MALSDADNRSCFFTVPAGLYGRLRKLTHLRQWTLFSILTPSRPLLSAERIRAVDMETFYTLAPTALTH